MRLGVGARWRLSARNRELVGAKCRCPALWAEPSARGGEEGRPAEGLRVPHPPALWLQAALLTPCHSRAVPAQILSSACCCSVLDRTWLSSWFLRLQDSWTPAERG